MAAAVERLWLVPPSKRVATGAGLARATTDSRLTGHLRGELDAITLKALAVKPDDRYSSVAELGADIHRYLRAKPVQALDRRIKPDDLIARLSRNPNVRIRHAPPVPAGDPWTVSQATRSARRVSLTAELLAKEQGESSSQLSALTK